MRLRKHRRTTNTNTSSTPAAPRTTQPTRSLEGSASDTDDSTHKAPAEVILTPADEERIRQAEEARKRAKADLFLNSEVKRVATEKPAHRRGASTATATAGDDTATETAATATSAAPTYLGSVTSERGSYLARLSAQAEAESHKVRKHKPNNHDDDDDDSIYLGPGRHHAPGIVRHMAQKHHRKTEKKEKQRRVQRMRRIAALDPLKENERAKGAAKETVFMALIRKYGGMAQEDAQRTTPGSEAGNLRDGNVGGPDSEDLETTVDGTTPGSETSSMDEHSAYLVDTLDVVDPGVSAASHLSNIGNSLMFPNIPGLYDRRPVIDLPAQEVDPDATSHEAQLQMEEGLRLSTLPARSARDPDDLHLDAYVHELLTKKQKFKRAMQGVWAFLKTPIGVIAGIYGFLVVFGGAALVLFLVGAIPAGDNKDYWVELFSQFENGLFTITGVGLIPWRLRDTYRMAWIAYYQHLTWRLRKKQGLPELADKNDIPSVAVAERKKKKHAKKGKKHAKKASTTSASAQNAEDHSSSSDNDSSSSDEEDEANLPLAADLVLTPQQAHKLHTLQTKFADSQSWYRPHETFTHHAFSINHALWITIFNDLNSLFQCLLCGYMWGYATHYHDRPAWSTGIFMPCSFLAGIAAGVFIWKGGEKSKKKSEVEEKLLAAFAKDVDAKVDRLRAEAQEKEEQRARANGAIQQASGLGTVEEQDSAGEKVAGEGAIDLGKLATDIAEKDS